MIKMKKRRGRGLGRMQWFTSCLSTTLVLTLLGLLVLCSLGAYRLSENVRETLTVTLLLDDDLDSVATEQLMQRLELEPYTRQLTLVTAEQALAEQIETLGTDPTDFMGENPFTASIELNVCADYACADSLHAISTELRKMWQVTDVVYQRDLVENLNATLQRIALFLAVLAAMLTIISIVLINNTVRLSVYARRFIIHTMRLVGASWGFIRRPFLMRSLGIGLTASFVASIVLVAMVVWAWDFDSTAAVIITPAVVAVMIAVVFVSGLLLTLVCTWFSVGRFLCMREREMYR